MKKIALVLVCLTLVTGLCFGEKVRKKMPSGEWKFVELSGESKYDTNGNVIYEKRENGTEYSYTYDSKGNMLSRKEEPYGSTDKWEYDDKGRLTYEKIGYNTPLKYEYDKKGNLIRVYEDTSYSPKEILYDYEDGNLIYEENDFTGLKIIYEYDDDNNLFHSFDQNDDEKFYEYENGNLVSVVDGNDNLLESYAYNDNGKLIKKVIPSRSWYGNDYIEEYDALGNLLRLEENGYTYIYEYNARGLVIKEIKQYYSDEYEYSFEYEFDSKDRITKRSMYLVEKRMKSYK